MANTFYTTFLNGLLNQTTPIDFDVDNICWALIDNAGADGAPVITDDFWDDQDGSMVNSLSANLASKTVGSPLPDGVFDAANLAPAWTSVSGATVESIVLLKTTGTPATSPLICWFDNSVTGIPLTPNSGDVNLTFNASGIIKV